MTDLRYPLGRFEPPAAYTPDVRARFVAEIEQAPAALREAIAGLTLDQLQTPYRDGGWTVAQVVHHLPDSHMNGYVRFKLALTERDPLIKPYVEAAWAELPDARASEVECSLDLLDGLHRRWLSVLKNLAPEDFGRTYRYPDRGPSTLDRGLALYAWHGRHHTAHITTLRQRMGW